MKHILTAIALCTSSMAAAAAPLEPVLLQNMIDQIGAVMEAKLCAVANDTQDYGDSVMVVILPAPVGVRRIKVNNYNWFRNTGYAPGVAHQWLMQDRAMVCAIDGLDDRCIAMRSYFKTEPLASSPPGRGVKAFVPF